MKEYLNEKLSNNTISSKVLLARARLAEISDWNTPTMNDYKYLPFYYHLGTQISAKKVFELGFGLGLTSSSFLQSCKADKFVGFQITNNDHYYSLRLGSATLKEYFFGNIKLDIGNNKKFDDLIVSDRWDVCFITDKVEVKFLRGYIDKIWENLETDGLVVVDHLKEDSRMNIFKDWCECVNREPEIYETRYKTGIIKR